jgi:hypothetical protein
MQAVKQTNPHSKLQEILLKGKKGQLLTEIWVNCAEKQAFRKNALV